MPNSIAETHRVDWDDLRYVLAVARAGSLAGAARALGVNHSTVLRRLGAYEARIGARLFERLPSGYVPTAAGEAMVKELVEIDAAIHDTERRAAGQDRRIIGTVRLSTTDTLMASVLPPALARVRAEHPSIVLEISTANRLAVLTRREADIALRPTASPPETLVGRRIAGLGYAAYAAPSYLSGRTADLALGEHLWLAPDASLGETAAARWLRANLREVEPVVRADSFVSLRDLAVGGLGVALLPCYLGDTSPGLIRLPRAATLDLGSTLWLLTHADLRRVARIDAVVSVLTAALSADRTTFEG
ncbi:LysR family transcriptional regulator [Methylobacterium oxalidis]|uniref:LysR family transcriptional regulator n=1 Tax=Methylobacterium oxalidis TaxID=944322 RepID=A0A512J684_9HYPH|nr:LysR family transcriptional regulator [Methylobacterium oxalidis]GEP05420.1 LysR family transcriptional regulator [Methylobacterium oxalidis]GJE34521.1 hypothetical protein LDDCCGHA_4733 [Methylobacterium oxalidis]GLS66310.1 LysR family transcriptional regulator [Methylobacterium oxalidis]